MKKRIFSIVLSLCMVLALMPMTAFAETTTDGNFEYSVSEETNEVTITKYIGSGGAVEIPEKIDGKTVTAIGKFAFSYCTSIKSVTIPEGVTSIELDAFGNCTSLESVTILDGVTSIGGAAFYNCTSLESVTIPDSVTSIGAEAFYNCTNLKNVTIPEGVTDIGSFAFYKCKNLKSVIIPKGVTSISMNAFDSCTSLESIMFEEISQLTEIGGEAFDDCTSLERVIIPNGVIKILDSAFADCTSLESVEVPSSVSYTDWGVFYGCTSLESIFLPDNLDASDAEIPNETSQVRYSLDETKGEITIIKIELGTGKTGVAIPATICGYPVVAVADNSLLSKISSHTCVGGTATCQTKAICGICKQEYGDYAKHTLIKTEAKDATCTEDGNTAYWTCSVCNKYFSDENGTNEIAENSWVIKAAHTLTKTEAKDATCTEDGNTAYWTCSVCNKYFSDENGTNEIAENSWVIKAAHTLTKTEAKGATVTETGNKEYWHCLDCGKYFADENGENEIELADTVIAKLPPEIIEGKGQSITAGEKKELTFKSNAAFSDFIRVEFDGKTLDEKNYTVKEGSTVVTLKADYVATLSAGEHTIGIVSESGTATATFTVSEKTAEDDDTNPPTGDNSHMALWIALLFVSGCLLTVTVIKAFETDRKRRNKHE